jgi:ADP-heptose:LPS heptosyltransferase
MTEIVIAPLSHNALRDWPADHYAKAIAILLERSASETIISVLGTAAQRPIVNEIVRSFPAHRVLNVCGLAWHDVLEKIRHASCVIGNNSGIAHLAGFFGVPTICIFGGSHQRTEWAPLRPNVVVLSREIACSPCQLNNIRDCRYGTACLTEIAPTMVVDAVLSVMRSSTAVNVPEHYRKGKAA